MAIDAVRFLHVLAVVFMAAPLYNLVVVGERVKFGKAPFAVDRYFENVIKGAAIRCYVYQLTALATGLALLPLAGLPWTVVFSHRILLAKLVLLLALMALLSVVHFSIQPAIEALLAQVTGDAMPQEIALRLAPLRLSRKRLAAVCLFLVITTVLLGLQVASQFPLVLTAILIALAALFAWRAYSKSVPLGWV